LPEAEHDDLLLDDFEQERWRYFFFDASLHLREELSFESCSWWYLRFCLLSLSHETLRRLAERALWWFLRRLMRKPLMQNSSEQLRLLEYCEHDSDKDFLLRRLHTFFEDDELCE
jgi:hypothetical protein